MEWLIIGLIAGVVYIWVKARNKRDESLWAAGGPKNAKQCPHCLEWVKRDATACRYCQRDVPLAGPWTATAEEITAAKYAKTLPKTQYGPTRQELKVIGIILVAIVVVAVGVMITSSNHGISGRNRGYEGNSAAVEACVSRGRAYFTEIGSFPTLSDGRDALAVARERCRRTTTAF